MTRQIPPQVDTVIVGAGPAALILSYILHGNVPEYDRQSPHPDPLLHNKLRAVDDLLSADVDHLTEHFNATQFSYSTQALPINVLFDTLNRPYGETDDAVTQTCIRWHRDQARAIPHVVLGNTSTAGGQWVDNPVKASWDIGALSYAGMLSLPGYTFSEFYESRHGERPPFYLRPARRDVADYFASYPLRAGISDSIFTNEVAEGICRTDSGFYIPSHNIHCRHLVLASGTFTKLIPPRPLLQPLLDLPANPASPDPLLIIGSGFSAADVIISAPAGQKLLHIYKWAPTTSPSPLRACHSQAYPEYAGVYKKMKHAALTTLPKKTPRPRTTRRDSTVLDIARDWTNTYEGLPNTVVTDVEMHEDYAVVTLQTGDEAPFQRRVSGLSCVIGRRGSLKYLEQQLRHEICPDVSQSECLTGQTLREAMSEDMEVTANVFVIGSLTGDSLIRFAYGGCGYAAGRIMLNQHQTRDRFEGVKVCRQERARRNGYINAMEGLDGHAVRLVDGSMLPLDRRKSEIAVE